jgi:carbon-monoxide dehydrogenase large subunit
MGPRRAILGDGSVAIHGGRIVGIGRRDEIEHQFAARRVIRAHGRFILEARHYFETHDSPYSYGIHAAIAAVDPETGHVRIERYVVVNDAGRLINPTIVEGQIVGGIAQGMGGALMEELAYDSEGQLVASSLLDYALPTARHLPNVEITHLETPTSLNPLGIKGLGEGGAIASHAAVANAVADALAQTDRRVTATPLTAPAILGVLHNGMLDRMLSS